MNAEDVLVETLKSRADFVHGVSVGAQVNELRVIWEGEHSSSGVETHTGVP